MQVLIADDNQINRQFLRAGLEKLGACVWEAGDGEQALRHCQQRAFDLVLLDMRMPGMNGLQTADRLKSQQPAPRVVVISADPPPPKDSPVLPEHGISAWLEKPLTIADLKALMRAATPGKAAPALTGNPAVPVLDWRQGLASSGGNRTLLQELLQMLATDIGEHRSLIGDPGADLNQRCDLLHRLRGAARFCAASELEGSCWQLEQRLRQTDASSQQESDRQVSLDQALKTFQWAADRLLAEIATDPQD